ncbi:pyridoxal-phosphate-dependent aminotransferase family protein [Enhygromyxa salina]|uniref:Purine catabolism protein PucG n=1 Tax=Enhygromyxa salina TaxID=215803 RepID=A0A2S9YPF5_9BACT|nr:alanine--glyoxylate aminotransferase family protein [Enhygromyxa salina]PRQ06975.1 Purine catabolism protein PucG [Enhygromyxa salina]
MSHADPFRSFEPPRRMLMGPGPSDVHPRVLQAMARPTIGHLDPAFVELMDEVKRLLQYAMRTDNPLTFPISAPGSAGMEACLVNLIEPGDAVVVGRNGVFGGRMHSIVERAGGRAIAVDDEWGTPVDPDKVEAALNDNPDAKLLAFVHAETSTGALSDAARLAALAQKHDCLTVVDAVTSLGGVPLEVDGWGLDAVYSGSQKCMSAAPGLSPVSFSARAVERIQARATPVQSWFLDLSLVMGYWGGGAKRAYHHTAPVNAIYGLHEALVMVHEEGLEQAWARHRRHHEALAAGLSAMGLRLRVAAEHRLPQLNVVELPTGLDDGATRARLLRDYGLEVGGGLGDLAGKVWRIGLMGTACTRGNVLGCLAAIDDVLRGAAPEGGKGLGVAAALAAYGPGER